MFLSFCRRYAREGIHIGSKTQNHWSKIYWADFSYLFDSNIISRAFQIIYANCLCWLIAKEVKKSKTRPKKGKEVKVVEHGQLWLQFDSIHQWPLPTSSPLLVPTNWMGSHSTPVKLALVKANSNIAYFVPTMVGFQGLAYYFLPIEPLYFVVPSDVSSSSKKSCA